MAKPKRGYRRFRVSFWVDIDISSKALRRGMSKKFARNMYELATAEKVAEHVAFNMVTNDLALSQMDGFADMSDELAVLDGRLEPVEAEEITVRR